MDDVAIGRTIRAIRRRRGWRQVELAAASGCSQALISRIEGGAIEGTTLGLLRTICRSLEVRLELRPSWRGAGLDRLLDADHATIVAAVADRLEHAGWEVALEVTYAEFGERGSIDVLGTRRADLAAVVVEAKSDIPSTEQIGRKLDEKARLAPKIVERRFGWRPVSVGRVLALPDTARLRRVVDGTPALRRMFGDDGRRIGSWLRTPTGPLAGALFLPDITLRNGRRRIRVDGPPSRVASRSGRAHRPSATGRRVPPAAPRTIEHSGE